MRKLIYPLLICWCLWVYGSFYGLTQNITSNATKKPIIHKSVVNISGVTVECTGFIGKKNYIITAKHCIQESIIYVVTYWDKKLVPAVVVFESKYQDIAILKAPTFDYPAVAFAPHVPLELGDLVHHIRYVLGEGQLRANGVYAAHECMFLDKCYHWIAIAGVPGDSGGALFRSDTGEVVGVTSMSYWPLGAPMTMFVPIEDVVVWLYAN